jgi:hypothetical protein
MGVGFLVIQPSEVEINKFSPALDNLETMLMSTLGIQLFCITILNAHAKEYLRSKIN